MKSLPKSYTILFDAVTDALEKLNQQNYGEARDTLIQAQQAAEEAYLSESSAK